ncbi:hypothetical protein T439DRAFT_383848 [Meredithblackwellia eburnea MCA 4105]
MLPDGNRDQITFDHKARASVRPQSPPALLKVNKSGKLLLYFWLVTCGPTTPQKGLTARLDSLGMETLESLVDLTKDSGLDFSQCKPKNCEGGKEGETGPEATSWMGWWSNEQFRQVLEKAEEIGIMPRDRWFSRMRNTPVPSDRQEKARPDIVLIWDNSSDLDQQLHTLKLEEDDVNQPESMTEANLAACWRAMKGTDDRRWEHVCAVGELKFGASSAKLRDDATVKIKTFL